MQENSALGRALAMVRDLRTRCPWDRAQTREIAASVSRRGGAGAGPRAGRGRRRDHIRDELSDLLLHLAFQLVIAEERGEFSPDDVADGLEREDAAPPSAPLRAGRGRALGADQAARSGAGSTLAGIVPTLPPLLKAYRLQERAASVGLRLARRRRAEREGA